METGINTMTDIATNEPIEIVAGDHVTWKRSFSHYKASAGWNLMYYLVHPTNSKITITASASGDDYLVDEAIATTTTWPAGNYKWQAFVSDGTDRYKVDEGSLEIKTDFASVSVTTFDDRAHCEKVLASIEAVIESRASKDQENYSMAGRSLTRTPIADLLVLRDKYRIEVKRGKDAEKLRNGLGGGNMILTRFT